MVRFVVLDDAGFQAEYRKAFDRVNLQSDVARGQFREDLFALRDSIVSALKQKWTERDDFEVSWDFDYCLHCCGGVYSERIFCPEYVMKVASVLAAADSTGKWTYHTCCEIIVNPHGKTAAEMIDDRGECFLRGGICVINGSSMAQKHRARLGCTG
jgi:hypothetical protein